jgi:hypothetical protein
MLISKVIQCVKGNKTESTKIWNNMNGVSSLFLDFCFSDQYVSLRHALSFALLSIYIRYISQSVYLWSIFFLSVYYFSSLCRNLELFIYLF